MNKNYTLINGQLAAKEDARLSITDLAFQRGYGIFDFFKTVDGQPVFLDDHLDRLYFSAAEMYLPVIDRVQLKENIQLLMEKNHLPDSGIRITVTGGCSEDGYKTGTPNTVITQTPFRYNSENFDKGTRLVTYEHQRQLPRVKTIDYLQAIRLQSFVQQNNADDVLYHSQSAVSECPRSNFFLVNGQHKIITPAANVLEGITRKKILSFTGFNTKEAIITLADIAGAREAFITSTTKMVLPVLAINGVAIGNGKPGMLTKEIFQQLLQCQGIQ